MEESKKKELMGLVQQAMKNKGAKMIADDLKKPYSTLMSELNVNDKDHKLGAWTFFELLDQVDHDEILNWLGRYYGYLLIPMQFIKSSSSNIERLMIQSGQEFGEISKTFLEVTDEDSEDGQNITSKEWKLLDQALLKAIQSYYQIRNVSELVASEKIDN